MTVSDEVMYSGVMSVGVYKVDDSYQSSDNINYDTRSTESVVPDTNLTSGWFDASGYSGYYDADSPYTYTIGTWEGGCYPATLTMCMNNTQDVTSGACVESLSMCMLYEGQGAPGESSGVVGLGRPTSSSQSDQTDNFVQ